MERNRPYWIPVLTGTLGIGFVTVGATGAYNSIHTDVAPLVTHGLGEAMVYGGLATIILSMIAGYAMARSRA